MLLWAIVRAQDFLDPASPNWTAFINTFISQQIMLELQIAAQLAELTALAIQWDLAGCWSWQNTPGGGGGGGGDEPPDSSGTCHQEYAYVEESYDGGITWYVVWEGYINVC